MSGASPRQRPRRSPTPTGIGTKASSPDPIKDAILSASGTGWSPLRIAKRDSPVKPETPSSAQVGSGPNSKGNKLGLARRQSSSYNHVRSSQLVSNSPFKTGSDGPTGAKYRPSPQYKGLDGLRQPARSGSGRKASGEQRRVSAERRTKSYENARPPSSDNNSTPRRPSKSFQQKTEVRAPLIDKIDIVDASHDENVADTIMDVDLKTDFAVDIVPRPATPPRSAVPDSLQGKKTYPSLSSASRIPVAPGSTMSNSPKSNLVSKRLIGPRSISGSSLDSNGGKRRRRPTTPRTPKKVTFDPLCNVVEYSPDEHHVNSLDGGQEDYEEDDNYDYSDDRDEVDARDDAMDTEDRQDDSLQMSVDNSVDDFVETVLAQLPATPPTDAAHVNDVDAEGDVPHGRTHHADRQREHHESLTLSLDSHYDIDSRRQEPSADVSLTSVELTPPAARSSPAPEMDVEDGVPYGRSHHAERQREHRDEVDNEERSAAALPGSPSPLRTLSQSGYMEHLVPMTTLSKSFSSVHQNVRDELDPFALPGDLQPPSDGAPAGSLRSPRISREDVLRKLELKRAVDDDDGPLATGNSPRTDTPTRRVDKPLPIAPGPPLIAIPRFDVAGDVSFSESLNFGSTDEKEKLNPDLGEVSALDRLMLGVEQELMAVEHSPDVSSSIGMSTPAFDIMSTTEDESAFEPTTPMTPATPAFAPAESGTEADNEDDQGEKTLLSATFSSSHDMDVDATVVGQHQVSTQLLALPQPAEWIASGRQSKSSNGSTRSTRSSTSTRSNIAARAASIKQKKREKRESEGRARPRRTQSAADAEDMKIDAAVAELEHALSLPSSQMTVDTPSQDEDIPLSETIDHELRRRLPEERKYRMREASSVVYAADEKISTVGAAGDVDSGRAWRSIKRPSDMNEYARQIREFRAQEKPGKSYGKVFVRVLGIKGLTAPIPSQPTLFTCTLNNGIHLVTTPECRLAKDCNIDQEFELIEHPKLEFTLTVKVKRGAHLQAAPAPKPIIAAPPPPPVPSTSHSKVSGMLAFFGGGSPKKAQKSSRAGSPALQPPPEPQTVSPAGLARYLKADGTLGRVYISFPDILSRCDTKILETGFNLVGVRPGSSGEAMVLGELVLQVFRLPPIPGITASQLPQSLEECRRGLKHANWHKAAYCEGALTQLGGDCTTWKRRPFRLIGASMVAYSEVAKRITSKIDLKHATSIHAEDTDSATMSRRRDSADAVTHMERSFRIKFDNGEDICFYADTDEEKEQWLQVLKAIIGHVPPNPMWAEFLWQRQQDALQKTQSSQR